MIKLENVCKEYKKGKVITKSLNGLNLNISSKGLLSILGPSGCGKTTLLNIIGGLDKITSGKLYINGVDSTEINEKDWDIYRNNTIGFIFQDFNLIDHLSVYDNIVLSLKLNRFKRKDIKSKVTEVLEKVGLSNKISKKTNQLSGGEKQRVAIARAIINEPEIILADEPTGALDSKTSADIMKILKDISKEKIVVMVTHNTEIAKEYSDRIIKMEDGKIESDEVITDIKEKEDTQVINIKKNKLHISTLMGIGLSFKNLSTKIFRTICTIFAGSIGLIAVALIVTVSEGVSAYVDRIQKDALKDKPITITSSSVYTSTGNIITNREEFPDTNEITVSHTLTNYLSNSTMDEELVETVESLDPNNYTIIDYDRSISMKIFRQNELGIGRIYTSYFTEMSTDSLMDIEYDVIAGKRPTKYNEVALLVDTYNTISASVLNSIGIYSEVDSYTFEDIIGQTYMLIDNNDYYMYNEEKDMYETYSRYISIPELYSKGESITITAIMRENPNCSYNLYQSGIIYTKDLTDYVKEKALESNIVKDQIKYGYGKNVLTGKPFEEKQSSTSSQSIEYQYENQLEEFGAVAKVSSIKIYTDNFEDRKYIEDTVKNSDIFGKVSNVYYRDYMASVAEEFDLFIKILTKALIIFALISVFVSCIMIGIITYISVNEREKEIGILRCIGARKIDILKIFCLETFVIGVLSGLLGVVLAYAIKDPINTLIQNLVKENVSNASSVVRENLVNFKPMLLIWLVLGNGFITIISGLIPSIKASLKKPINALKTL